MAIRYDQNLLAEIRRTVKNYQTKRQRVLNRGGEIIPDPAYVSTFLNEYTNRRELLRDLKKLRRYSVRGSEEIVEFESGLKLTRYEIQESKRLVAVAKRNITLQLKQTPEPSNLQPLARGEYEHLKARYEYISQPLAKLSPRQFKIYDRIAHGEGEVAKRRRVFYDNVQDMVDQITFGLPNDITDRFRKAIGKLSIKQLTDLVTTDPYLSSIRDWYYVYQGGGNVPQFEEAVESLTDYINEL